MNTAGLQVAFVLFFLFLVYGRWYRSRTRRRYLPPGPPGLPVLGNVADIAGKERGWLAYASMAKKYGDFMYLEALGQPILVISSFQRAIDYLDKLGTMQMDPRLLDMKWNTGFLPYGDAWRRRRRLLHNYFHQNAEKDHEAIQIMTTHYFLRDMLDDPARLRGHVRRLTNWTILQAAYGHDVLSVDDPFVSAADHSLAKLNQILERGVHIVDIFPVLKYVPKWFPGAQFRRLAEEAKNEMRDAMDSGFEEVKTRMSDGTASPSLASYYLDQLQRRDDLPADQERIIRDAAGVAYAAGSDTTISSIMSFILAMTLYPEVQKKAQAELDLVVGADNLPTFDHKQDLPYAKHILWETLRWQPVTPINIPHATVAEDVYDGYRIPAGTVILANIWAMLHDEELYPDPEVFNPDRYSSKGGSNPPPDPSTAAFGFGRRICPGRHLAMNTIWIAIVSILSTFTIERELDESGNEIIPEVAYTTGFITYPKPFKCRFTPRSAAIRQLLESQV